LAEIKSLRGQHNSSNYITKDDWFKHFSPLINNSTKDALEPDADGGNMTDIVKALFNAEITEEVLTSIKKLKRQKVQDKMVSLRNFIFTITTNSCLLCYITV